MELIAVRHGESVANAALPVADAAGLLAAGVPGRDADVPLSERGRAQALALGEWLAAHAPPDVVLCSPYARARETWALAGAALPASADPPPVRLDERLRDREAGVLELLTMAAIRDRFPDEVARRARVGEFYYRAPGGESFPDVALRLRGVLAEAAGRYAGHRVLG
ncbi:MAG TPA: histidine phosphatase family protein [Pilimelia sp.]|nr:histidine phosphatase family protein [Pilimelia sp.]